jgi:2'-hydroxyisoflavone reductase
MASYGEKKAECERVLISKEWLDSIIFRPALIYGRYDPTDRFYYWLYRVQTQNDILIPQDNSEVTNTYSEDFARLIQSAIFVEKHNQVYNASTHSPVSIKEFIEAASKQLKKKPKIVNAALGFLEENKVEPLGDLPLWLGGMNLVLDNSRALKDFPVEFHSFDDSVRGCIDYYSSLGWQQPKYGLSLSRENDLIAKIA